MENMKTIRISDETHRKLTATLGTLMAETGKSQTYDSTIKALLTHSIKLPREVVMEVENFIKEAIRFKLKMLKDEYERIEITKQKYDKLNRAVKEMNMPYYNAAEFIEDQIDKALKQYKE